MALPRKGKAIEGVDSSSLLALQATVFRAQLQRRGQGALPPPVARGPRLRADAPEARNRGVDERDARVHESEQHAQRRADSALQRKSELYAQMMRGEAEGTGVEAGCIDWDRKRFGRPELMSSDMQRDAERCRAAEVERGAVPSDGAAADGPNTSVKRYLDEVVQEASADREQAAIGRAKRDRDRADRSELIAAKRAAVRKVG
ncbi:hypothetical protein T492DRAFT_1144614 [Pavlovales sp. CCMP2436]|nr:hypothetical protein T492DRAFT_1144614 [Pavlovales sp. CCMP2436]|mmetsp:Transcript_15123/g.38375  ORF Transcript_15123/g.38375 Transcript_15123/m.38375 type:complete len:203 (+) Transcript_15123:74-682(+)